MLSCEYIFVWIVILFNSIRFWYIICTLYFVHPCSFETLLSFLSIHQKKESLSLKHSYQCEKPLRRLLRYVLLACRTPKHWSQNPGSAWCNSILASEVQILLLQSFHKLDFLPCPKPADLLNALSWQSEALSLPLYLRTPSYWVGDMLLAVLHEYPGWDWECLHIS